MIILSTVLQLFHAQDSQTDRREESIDAFLHIIFSNVPKQSPILFERYAFSLFCETNWDDSLVKCPLCGGKN
jgi:hypothetical protein